LFTYLYLFSCDALENISGLVLIRLDKKCSI
jgi:hypothetical protein